MIRLLSSMLLLAFCTPAISQYFNSTLVYRLSNKAYEQKIHSDTFKLSPADCQFLVGRKDTLKNLEPGYYIYAEAQEESLFLSLKDHTNISTILLNNNHDFAVQVIDSAGVLVNATVLIDNKKVEYDAITKSYRLSKRKKGGLLKVEALGQVVFYEVEAEDTDYDYDPKRPFRFTRVGFIVTTPIRWGKNTYHYFKRGFKYDNWYINWARHNPFKNRKDKPFKGYIALNKPIYRHGDTLQLKAYITDYKGKPWKEDIVIEIYGNRFSKYQQLKPDKNGSVFYNMIIGDSLTLDQTYQIRIRDNSQNYNYNLYHRFKLEDYQLDEVSYSLSSTQQSYQKGEKIILLAEGKDKNGFTITDGEIKIIALRGKLKSSDAAELRIPDTIWIHKQALDTRGETQIIFPDSLLPDAELGIKFQATFTNSNGELHEKTMSVNYVSLLRSIKIEVKNGYILANYMEGEKSVPMTAELRTKGSENIDFIKTVELPFKEKLHPYANYYEFSIANKNLKEPFPLNYQSANITASGIYVKDSIFVNITNPQQIPINYWISKGEHIVATGQTGETTFQWQHEDKSQKPYHLRYQYLWASYAKSEVITIQSYKNALHIEVEQPPKVLPGTPVQVQVKVSDHKNNNLQGVNLTAGAVNAQFNSSGSFSELKIDYKNVKPLKKYSEFEAERQDYFYEYHRLTKDWYAKFSLQDMLYYQLRFSGKPIYMHYDTLVQDSFYRNVAQFAPYIVNKGRTEPIIMIYCNRKLVYYYETNDNMPYSFVGKEGYNLITIRTPKYEYWIDSVILKKGQKLEFAIDEALFSQDSSIQRKLMPDSLTTIERKLLKAKILLLRKPLPLSAYLWQDSTNIHIIYTNGYQKDTMLIGPFSTTEPINYAEKDRFRTRFIFEPGFSYNIFPRRERLYQSPHFDRKIRIPLYLAPQSPRQNIYRPSDIQYVTKKSVINTPLQSSFKNESKNGGSFQFFYSPSNGKYLQALALVNDSSKVIERFHGNINSFSSLPVATYELTLVNHLYEIYQQRIEIKPDTLLYYNFSNIPWQKDTLGIVSKLFYIAPIIINAENLSSIEEQFDIPRFFGNGIQGRLTDDNGDPLIGATVLLKGTTTGTVTDIDGTYFIQIPNGIENPTLVFSYTGYNTQEIITELNNPVVDVVMTAGQALSEVVVTGYGISRAKVSAPTTDISALQARVAGLEITSNDIKIRGSRSLGEDYYIDGVRMDDQKENKLDLANPELLESSGIRSNFRDYAYWQPNLITDHNGEAYFTVTYPDDITSWNTFVLGMDRKLRAGVAYGNTKSYKPLMAQLAMPRFLVEGDEADIIGKSVNYTNDTLYVKTSFKIGERLLPQNEANVRDGFTEKTKVITPSQQDSLQVTYALQMGEYIDGEQRSIPILRRGMEDTKGYFQVLNKDTSFVITPQLPEGQLEVYVEGQMLDAILRDILYLKNYKYGCNEQTASRLLASLMDKKIAEQLGKKYLEDDNIIKLIERLEKTQNKDGSWGWWSGNAWHHWMTIYVTSALHEAKKAGFKSEALSKGLNFIIHHTEELDQQNFLYTLQILAESEMPFDFETPLARLDTAQLDLYEQFMTIRIKQKLGREYSLDSIYHYQQKNTFGSIFWEQKDYYWYNKTLYPTLLAYEILREAGKTEQLPLIRQYFFQHKNILYWGNTFKTAQVLQTILPDILEESSLTDIANEHCIINDKKITNFPYRANYSANQNLTITKSGKTPLFFTAYQQFFNTEPEHKADLFSIKSTLYQDGKPTNHLQQGEKATLKVEVEVMAKADYVMIEIPIPASCSYVEKPNGWRFPEVHREYFKEKTAIFCQELSKGKYEFYIELEPRFTGNYTLNPVKVEQMYFPVFNGNNEMKQVRVE